MATDVAGEELSRVLRRRGALILAVAGPAWAGWGTSRLTISGTGRVVTLIVVVAVTVTAIALGLRSGSLPVLRRRLPAGWPRQVGLVTIGQVTAIGLAVAVLNVIGRPALVLPVVCLICGVHFWPLARLFGQWQYRWTGVLLCLAAVASVISYLAGSSGAVSQAVAGIGAAVTMWGTSLHVATHD